MFQLIKSNLGNVAYQFVSNFDWIDVAYVKFKCDSFQLVLHVAIDDTALIHTGHAQLRYALVAAAI